jgi:ribosome biogenesis protein BRX1
MEENSTEKKFVNKQRTLIFCARGVAASHRHFMNDIKKLLPHSKDENKFDHKADLKDIVDLCLIKDCSNCMFFRKESNDLCLYMGKVPNGPTLKFKVSNSKHLLNPFT